MRSRHLVRVLVAAAIVVGCGDVESPPAEPAIRVEEPAVPVKPEPEAKPVAAKQPEPPTKSRLEPEVDHPNIPAIYTDLRFDKDQATLGPEWGDLGRIAAAIKDGGYTLVEIHGYIDRGESADLALARADYVKKQLVKAGAPAKLLCTVTHTKDPQMQLPQLAGGLRVVKFVAQTGAKACPASS